jgi:hypothetical protein
MLEEGGAGRTEHASEFRPRIGRAHIDDLHRLDPGLGRLNAEWSRKFAGFDAAPESSLGRH